MQAGTRNRKGRLTSRGLVSAHCKLIGKFNKFKCS